MSGYVAKWAPLVFRADSVIVSNDTFQVQLTGPDNTSVVVDRTACFTNWIPMATNTLPPGGTRLMSFPTDTNVQQFFRARLGP